MKKWIVIFAVVLLALIGLKYYTLFAAKPTVSKEDSLVAEHFIRDYLMQEDGRIATDLTSRKDEYLSETVGLWMEYLVLQDDQEAFEQQVKVLKKYFLTKDYLVVWEVKDKKKAPANAFIDDLRIMNALYEAGERWSNSSYKKLAKKIKGALVTYHIKQDVFIDHVDLKTKSQAEQVTLSYLIPSALDKMETDASKAYKQTRSLFLDAPINPLGFLPKTYDLSTGSYIFEDKVNMIDQLYMGYHRAQWGADVSQLLEFIRQTYTEHGVLYGRYDLNEGTPIVEYEAVAVYALAILLAIETDENELAEKLYENMKAMQQTDKAQPYYGGYIDVASKSTHSFDNLLALIAERKGYDEGIFKARD